MANSRGYNFTIILILAISYFLIAVECHRGLATPPANTDIEVFVITNFGAKGDGKPIYANGESMNGIAMMKAWQKACHCSNGPSKVVVPPGTFVAAEVIFAGPCKNHVTIELQGNVIADSDISQFPNKEFIVFQDVDRATFTGQGTIDVSSQAKKFSHSNYKDVDFSSIMPSIKFYKAKNMAVEGIRSVNPAAYHVLIVESECITIENVKFEATSVESNTNSNGIYISASSKVNVSNSYIKTSDDCVTVAPGSTDISITGITCVAGQGISIGSRPYTTSLDVSGVLVKGCSFKGSAFGVRIIPRLEFKASLISNIKVEDLIMEGVQNPIVIDQVQSIPILNKLIQAKIEGVFFKNIRGTTTTKNAISFSCCPKNPCEGINVVDIDLSLDAKLNANLNLVDKTLPAKGLNFLVNCLNAKVNFGGKHDGLSCGILP
ncbi:exopolygalacturonase clone GBGE184-like [Chenopodium quinoa]|uniref:Pectin lyase-like superfamily protein n=1 Tax=Chenopodium quinoa TaxID=63459 RepID=A0A803LA12_CHEQI|nr:exopolygalacturonase clone GBGE184-like [Chenopodium quinoa]